VGKMGHGAAVVSSNVECVRKHISVGTGKSDDRPFPLERSYFLLPILSVVTPFQAVLIVTTFAWSSVKW